MPNIATVLKAEVTRLARKELRAETEALRKAAATQRAELAALKRRVQDLEKALKLVARVAASSKPVGRPVNGDDEGSQFRFRAAGMAANRKRLGLSAAEFGLLVGATGQSVYAWEAGKSKPRPQNLAAIAALRGAGKREVAKKLAELKGS
jgi:DNA-binding transcriptional regulator YiaG